MSLPRPAIVDPEHLHPNGKLYSDEFIEEIKHRLKEFKENEFIPRHKITPDAPFSITRMDGNIFAIYYGKKQGKHLGSGTFGKVKLAQNLETGEWVALKMTRQDSNNLDTEITINKILGTGRSGLYYRKSKKRPNETKIEFMVALAHGLGMKNLFNDKSFDVRLQAAIQVVTEYVILHNKGVLHCDIKPDNMFYDEANNKVTIIDFGQSRLMDYSGQDICPYRGSPSSIPPEIKGTVATNIYNEKTECFGVGVALAKIFGYKLIPNPKSEASRIKYENADYLPIVPSANSTAAEQDLIALINSMINKKPSVRPDLPVVLENLCTFIPENNKERDILILRSKLLRMAEREHKRIKAKSKPHAEDDLKMQALKNLITSLKDDTAGIEHIQACVNQYKHESLAKQTKASQFFHKKSRADTFIENCVELLNPPIRTRKSICFRRGD